jgi:N utilization substance protein A
MQTGYETLVALPGIGISMADALYEKGFFSAEEIANASIEDLIQLRGIGGEKATKLIAAAREAVANATQSEEIPDKAESPSTDDVVEDVDWSEPAPPEDSIEAESK